MDSEATKFRSGPVGSLAIVSDESRLGYFNRIFALQPKVRDMLYSGVTGAYLRGVARTYNVPSDQVPQLALLIVKIAVGEVRLAQLAAAVSVACNLATDKAQSVARDVERELFSPIMIDLGESLRNVQQVPTSPKPRLASPPQNVINLKDRPPAPPKPIYPPAPPRLG